MQNISFYSISDSRIPIAITDLNLTLQYGNKSLYTLIGDDLFYSIYKVVVPSDRPRLSDSLANISIRKHVTDVFSILYNDNEYHHMLLSFTYIKANQLIKIEFQYLSDIIHEHNNLEFEIKKYRTLFTLDGDNLFEYNPQTYNFKFYWISENQNIIRFNGDFNVWKEDILNRNLITNVDKPIFQEMCDSITSCSKSFEYELSSSILSDGEIYESTKVNAVMIDDLQSNKILVGIWFLFNTIYHKKENHFIDNLYKDELTGLLNKSEITRYAQNILRHSPDNNIYLLILDLDNFKQCNDHFGHMFGDEILKDVSAILKNTIQQHGVAGRIGGDEFLIVLESIENEKFLRNMLRTIRANIQWLYKEKLSTFQLGCSMGVACYPKDALDYNTLFKLADYSLYIAKSKGKSRYVIYDYHLHGPVTCSGNDNSIITKNTTSVNMTSLADVNKKISLLYSRGINSINEVIEVIKNYFNLHNFAIYIHNLTNSKANLLNDNILIYLPLLFNPDYLALFEHNKSYCVTNIKNIEFTFIEIYNYFFRISSTSYFQCLLTDAKDNIIGMISYERSTVHSSWENDTKQLLSLISTIIESVIFTEETL